MTLNNGFCPICSGIATKPWRLGLVQCCACGVVLSPTIWQPQANEILEDEWFGMNYDQNKSFWVDLFERWNNKRTMTRLSAYRGAENGSLLEIGVGSGSFLNAARGGGYSVMGCDLSAPICRFVSGFYGIEMHCGPLDKLAGVRLFDVIVMNHVLEHVQEPLAFMCTVRKLLSPGGVIHMAVPNVECWEARLSGWTSFEPYHLSYFSPGTLRCSLKTSGLTIAKLETKDSFSGWFLALLRTALGVNRAKGAVTRSVSINRTTRARSGVIEHAYRLAMVLVGGGIWPLRWLQGKLGHGDEIVCIAHASHTQS